MAVVSVVTALVACVSIVQAGPTLPSQFVVSTGTTMPFPDGEPVAQSGAIYYDADRGQLRIDSYWMGNQRTFIADTQRKRAYMINGGTCVTSVISGTIVPVRVPDDAARDRGERVSVRGVAVERFHKVVKEDLDLLHVEYFVRGTNFTVVEKAHDTVVGYWQPWRVVSRRVPRVEMLGQGSQAGPRNWRFYGEDISDAIVRYGGDERSLTRFIHDIPVTIDFYNFVPIAPDPSIFDTPDALCTEPPTNTFDTDVDLFETQLNIMELTFNNEEGRRLMAKLEEQVQSLPSQAKDEL